MFKLLGSVDRHNWPDFISLPDAKHFSFPKKISNDLRSIFPQRYRKEKKKEKRRKENVTFLKIRKKQKIRQEIQK